MLMSTKWLLIVTALFEVATGIALFLVPSIAVELLLGVGLVSPQAFVLGRVTGAALAALGVACWLSRHAEQRQGRIGLIAGLLMYNVAVPGLLIHAATALSLFGIALWPGCVLHAALALWCVACLIGK